MMIVSQDGEKLFINPKVVEKSVLWKMDEKTGVEKAHMFCVKIDGVIAAVYHTHSEAIGWLEKLQSAYVNDRTVFNFY